VLEAVARQIGLAVERAALLTETRDKSRRLEALRELEAHISAQLDVDALLAVVAESVLRLIGGATAVVSLTAADAPEVEAQRRNAGCAEALPDAGDDGVVHGAAVLGMRMAEDDGVRSTVGDGGEAFETERAGAEGEGGLGSRDGGHVAVP